MVQEASHFFMHVRKDFLSGASNDSSRRYYYGIFVCRKNCLRRQHCLVRIHIAQYLRTNLSVLPEGLVFLKLRAFDKFHIEKTAVQTSNFKYL
jgi:hypothetical protein